MLQQTTHLCLPVLDLGVHNGSTQVRHGRQPAEHIVQCAVDSCTSIAGVYGACARPQCNAAVWPADSVGSLAMQHHSIAPANLAPTNKCK
jgi:hypothetical protein